MWGPHGHLGPRVKKVIMLVRSWGLLKMGEFMALWAGPVLGAAQYQRRATTESAMVLKTAITNYDMVCLSSHVYIYIYIKLISMVRGLQLFA